MKKLKKYTALLGLTITWLEDTFPVLGGDYMTEIVSIECIYETGVIIHVTPLSVKTETVTSEGTTKKTHSKQRLIGQVEDADIKELLKTSLPVSFKSANEEAEYDLYRLSDEGNIFYVGISKDVERRYKQHCTCSGTNLDLNLKIQEILRKGKNPDIDLVERKIKGLKQAQAREKYWISRGLEEGYPLVNRPNVIEDMWANFDYDTRETIIDPEKYVDVRRLKNVESAS